MCTEREKERSGKNNYLFCGREIKVKKEIDLMVVYVDLAGLD